MRRILLSLVLTLAVLSSLSGATQALTYNGSTLPYTDRNSFDAKTAVSVSVLTEEEVLEGHPDGSYRPNDFLNRAEFVEIIMRLVPLDAASNVENNCFVDVLPTAWYARSVCRAESLGYVRGNAVAGVPQSLWRFEPVRHVNYEEAVKILVELYAFPIAGSTEGEFWYRPYINAAQDADMDLAGLSVGEEITRGEMAQLTARFLAHSHGELDELDEAIANYDPDSSSSSSSSSRTSSSSSRSSTSSSMSSSSSVSSLDPNDFSLRPGFILLGNPSPVLASAEIFSTSEDVNITDIVITLQNEVPSIMSFQVYDEDGRFLGRAWGDSIDGTQYRLRLGDNDLVARQDVATSIYVRADTMSELSGGDSGDEVEVASVRIEGTGEWSTNDYVKSTTEEFPTFLTTNARLLSVTNAGPGEETLLSGTNRLIGEFDFEAETGNGSSDFMLNEVRFDIERTGDVTISNVRIRRSDSSMYHSCTNTATVITCDNIPNTLGAIETETRIQVYADVSVSDLSQTAALRLTINQAGSPTSIGAISWSDETTDFTWVQLSSPIVRGTLHRR